MTPIELGLGELASRLAELIASGGRLGLLTACPRADGRLALLALVLEPRHADGDPTPALPAGGEGAAGSGTVRLRPALWQVPLLGDQLPPLTRLVPQAHWAKRALYDLFGLRPADQAHPKPLMLHEAWPADFHPLLAGHGAGHGPVQGEPATYRFLEVDGEGVYEIPVGPIHAGIIEPGHFRFSCHGEEIHNLEIRLGYQHRGLEQQLASTPWRRGRFLAEAIASDTAAANALAHAMAIESLLGVEPAAVGLRTAALEFERVSSHIGDLNGLCSDIGFAAGAAIFSRLRGHTQALCERLTGSRFLMGYIVPGGVSRPVPAEQRSVLLDELAALTTAFERAEPLLLDNAAVLERMSGTGIVTRRQAGDIGLVGPAARASGIDYDVRAALAQTPYADLDWQPATGGDGDVLARATVRVDETRASLALLRRLLEGYTPAAPLRAELPEALPPGRMACGIVEAWRGELIHLVATGADGSIVRYAVKDPSFNNWTGLAVAVRGEVVSDFPLCNKSFGLSYSGSDL